MRRSNMYLVGIRYYGAEIISEEIMAENVSELVKDTNPKIQESQYLAIKLKLLDTLY